jgi:hypothetical protein
LFFCFEGIWVVCGAWRLGGERESFLLKKGGIFFPIRFRFFFLLQKKGENDDEEQQRVSPLTQHQPTST